MNRLTMLILLIPGLFLTSLWGCGGSSSTEKAEQIYYKALYSKVLTYDPALMTDTASLAVANQIYDGLLEFGPHFDIQPALAERWETSADGKVLTFQLRKNAKFHDGTPITAQDAVASFERLISKASVVAKHYDLIAKVEASDRYTFKIYLKNKFPPFAAILAGATAKVLPRNKFLDPKFFESPIGSGPFKVAINRNDLIVLKRNDNYWRETAKLEELHFIVGGENTGMKEAMNGELHDTVTYPFNGDEPLFKAGGQHLEIPLVATWIIGLNTRIKPFDRKAIRQRFKAAISSEEFIETFYPGQMIANGYIPPGLPGFIDKSLASPAKDHAELTATPIRIVIPIELAKSHEIKSYLENKLAKAGFKATIDPQPWEVLEKGFNNKSTQGFLMSMNADYPDSSFLFRSFQSNNKDNYSGLSSGPIDSLIEKIAETDSRSERASLYQNLAKLVDEESVTVNLLHYRAHFWFASCVQGVEINSLGDYYIPYRKISLASNCVKRKKQSAVAHAR